MFVVLPILSEISLENCTTQMQNKKEWGSLNSVEEPFLCVIFICILGECLFFFFPKRVVVGIPRHF